MELLLSEWRKVVVTLTFDEVEDVEYEALVQVTTQRNTRPRVRAYRHCHPPVAALSPYSL